MFQSAGSHLVAFSRRWIPDPFVFALGLTIAAGAAALLLTPSSPIAVLEAWYRGFWTLLEFGMQMVLILSTGYAIALAPSAGRILDWIAARTNTPAKVYVLVVALGGLFSLVSWGWVTLTAVLARALAERVKGLDYGYLTACVYFSSGLWVCGLSSSIPLLLNTNGNFLIEQGILDGTIPVALTLGSGLNLVYLGFTCTMGPLLMYLMRPRTSSSIGLETLRTDAGDTGAATSAGEAAPAAASRTAPSDRLNHSALLSMVIAVCGLGYAGWHFAERGFDVNLNIMAFVFMMAGLLLHRTPMGYVAAMRRACGNISGIIFQYPFYAGIMGIMMYTGLGDSAAGWVASRTSLPLLPLVAHASGAIVNLAIPSAGGEWAVIGPGLVEAARTLCEGASPEYFQAVVSRTALAVAYGETQTNMLQPFFLLIVLPVMGAGVNIRARDVMGHLVIPFVVFYTATAVLVTWMPL